MSNTFAMDGVVVKIMPKGEESSALILLQYGQGKDVDNSKAIDFVNAVLIRVPASRYIHVKDRLDVNCVVSVVGHVQGVMKGVMNEGYLSNELVADRILFNEWDAFEASGSSLRNNEEEPETTEAQDTKASK